jgi:hypothetical protein
MAHNMLKIDVQEPLNAITESRARKVPFAQQKTRYSVHFDSKSYNFFLYANQFPDYVIEFLKKHGLFRTHFQNIKNEEIMLSRCVDWLKSEVEKVFREYSYNDKEHILNKKIGLKFNNSKNSHRGTLDISIEYKIFYQKIYKYDNEEDEIFYTNTPDEIFGNLSIIEGFTLYEHSDELEEQIKKLQDNFYIGMNEFINKIQESPEILKKIEKLEENKKGIGIVYAIKDSYEKYCYLHQRSHK